MTGAILVTGASGFIGTALCRHLVRQGRRVVGVVRRPSAKLPAGVERRVIPDIGLATDWSGQLGDVDTVIHLAARVHVMRERAVSPLYAFRYVNTYGTRKLAKACVAQGVRRLVYISSVKALGDGRPDGSPYRDDDVPAPTDAYGQSKLEAERVVEEVGGDGRIVWSHAVRAGETFDLAFHLIQGGIEGGQGLVGPLLGPQDVTATADGDLGHETIIGIARRFHISHIYACFIDVLQVST